MKKKDLKTKKQPISNKNEWKIYSISIIGLLLFMFFGLPDEILYAKGLLFRLIPFLLLFFVLPYLILELLRLTNIENKWIFSLALSSTFIIAPIFSFWLGYISEKDLEKYENHTEGIVSEKWKSKNVWLLKCKFIVNGSEYETFSKTDKENRFHIGDKLSIRYSSKTPDNCEIVELK